MKYDKSPCFFNAESCKVMTVLEGISSIRRNIQTVKKHIVSVNGAPYGRYLLVSTTFHGRSSSTRLEGHPAVRSGYGADMLPDRYCSDAGTDQTVQQCATLAAVIAAENT